MTRPKKDRIEGQPVAIQFIEIPEGRRAANPTVVDALAESIKAVGLMSPISLRIVDGVKVLIAGLHRLRAYEKLGRTVIPAVVVDATDDEAALAEIDENLCRSELSDAEIAAVVARRKAIYEDLHPETKHGGDRRSKSQIADLVAPTFTVDAATKTGKSRDTIERAARRGRDLGPETLERIKGTSLDKGVELDALAKMAPEERAPIVKRAEAGENVSARPKREPRPYEYDKPVVPRGFPTDPNTSYEPFQLKAVLVEFIVSVLHRYPKLDDGFVRSAFDGALSRRRKGETGAAPTLADALRDLQWWCAQYQDLPVMMALIEPLSEISGLLKNPPDPPRVGVDPPGEGDRVH